MGYEGHDAASSAIYKHPNGDTIRIKGDGSWKHTGKDGSRVGSSDNVHDLASHIGIGHKESAREAGNQFVAPRYDKSHPEGFESPEYSGLKKMPEAHKQPGAKPWPVRQKQMHRQMGKAIDKGVLESRRRDDEEDDGTPRPIFLKDIAQKPERHDGWRGQVYSPPVTRLREGTGVVIKEF
jgi:hypothetical protein